MRVIRSVSSVENRFPPTVLPRWQTDNEFRKLLASFEKIIPLKYPSDLQSSSILTSKLLTRSEGTIGELKMLLAAASTDAQRNGAHHRRNHRRMQLYGAIHQKTAVHYLLTRSHLSSYGLVTFLSTSEIFLQIRASNTEMLTSSRWVVVVR